MNDSRKVEKKIVALFIWSLPRPILDAGQFDSKLNLKESLERELAHDLGEDKYDVEAHFCEDPTCGEDIPLLIKSRCNIECSFSAKPDSLHSKIVEIIGQHCKSVWKSTQQNRPAHVRTFKLRMSFGSDEPVHEAVITV